MQIVVGVTAITSSKRIKGAAMCRQSLSQTARTNEQQEQQQQQMSDEELQRQ
ncbi:GL17940 [Drosophila persimilis]|uniref:GL17940 n=1 Tax=Drosophila persimilis TaxID=7234 RepID=B4H1S5_DROPE|nr:GL17940 [Drosophila persimilis]